MSLTFSGMMKALEKRAQYRRTVAELHAMSPEVAQDLNIDKRDAERIAAEAVYGHRV